jgi:superoxide dismutase, Cu-Zn family
MLIMKKLSLNLLALSLVLVISQSGFGQMNMPPSGSNPSAAVGSIQKAVCILYPTQGNAASGTVTFLRTEHGMKVTVDVMGLSKGKHGFHIHEFGDCSASDGASAGGHFNPEGKTHGAPMDMSRHMGDMGNIVADESGKAHMEYIDPIMSFEGDHSIIGRSIILHKNEDDLKTQPTGNAGARIACGVIGIAK